MKYKVAFIVPYFGRFKNYFNLFLESCKYNDDYKWIIFTDDKTEYNYPLNVEVHYCNFSDLKKYVQKKFDFKIFLEYSYKFCDYKPAYGYIFHEYLKDFDFWGYCDTDIIFGNLSKFITNDLLRKYDKIGVLGHCTIIRNEYKYNMAFKDKIDGNEVYKEIFASPKKAEVAFDEEYNNSINNIFINEGYSVFSNLKVAGIYTKSSNFRLVVLKNNNDYFVEKKSKNFFVWQKGELVRYRKEKNKIKREEYAYIHFQSRQMKIRLNDVNHIVSLKIIPNSFDELETPIIKSNNFKNIKKKHFNLHYFILRTHNLIEKIKKF